MSKFIGSMYGGAVNNLMKPTQHYKNEPGFSVREIRDDSWRIFQKDECRIMFGENPKAN